MKSLLLIITAFLSLLLAGCGEPAPEPEKAPSGPQQVVMVPAQGKAAPPTGTAPTPAAPSANPTPDGKAPGDR